MTTSAAIYGFPGARRLTVVTVASLVLALVSVVAASTAPAGATGATSSNMAPGSYRPVPGARLLDTRVGTGAPKGAVAAGGRIALQVTGRGAVPATGVAAVALNLTVTAATESGHLTAYPAGTGTPATSNVNFLAGKTVANAVVVKVGVGGVVMIGNGTGGTTQIIADVQGYYLDGTPATSGAFASLVPARILDTRVGLGAPARAVAPHQALALPVAGRGGVPGSGVGGIVVNITVTQAQSHGYLTAYPGRVTRPLASNLNFAAHQTVAGLVTVRLGSDGKVDLYNGSSGTVQMVADIAGYYRSGTAATAGAYTPVVPRRLVDTRTSRPALGAGSTRDFFFNTPPGLDTSKFSAVVLTVTVTGGSRSGYVAVTGTGAATSFLNWSAGETVANQVVVPIGYDRTVLIRNGSPGAVNVVVDMSGYFKDPDLTWSSSSQADPWHSGFAQVSCASATFCLASDDGGNVASYDGATWSGLSRVDPSGSLEYPTRTLALSCPSPSFCAAVDSHGNALIRTGTTWSAPANVDNGHALRSVSCSSPSFCAAVDDGGAVVAFDGTHWTAPTAIGGNLVSVSCPTATFCLVADASGQVMVFNGATWTPSVGAPTGQRAVACSSPTFCVAGGTLGHVSRFNGSSWSMADTVDSSGQTIVSAACASATWCVVGGDGARVAAWNGTSWTLPSNLDPSGIYPVSLSCGSPTTCLAVDYTAVMAWTGASWSTPSHPQMQNTVTGLSCAASTFCAAVDLEGKALTYDGATWSTPVSLGGSTLADVSCASATFCVAVGGSSAYLFNGAQWSAAVSIDGGQTLSVVSCPSETFCMAADRAGGTVTYNGTIWALGPPAGSISQPVNSLSCVSPSFCAAGVGNGGFVRTYTNGAWTVLPNGLDPQVSLSCASDAFCAAGGYQLGDVMDGTFPGRFGPGGPILAATVTSISCPSSSFCLAADNYGNLAIYNGATWTVNINGPSYPYIQAGAKVSCATPDFCLVLGTFGGVSAVGTA